MGMLPFRPRTVTTGVVHTFQVLPAYRTGHVGMCALLGLRLPLFALFCPALVPRHSSSLQIVKSAFHPDKVRRHWDNPWIFNTFGFVPIVWIVLTVLLGEEIDKAAYSVLLVRILSLM